MAAESGFVGGRVSFFFFSSYLEFTDETIFGIINFEWSIFAIIIIQKRYSFVIIDI